MAPASLACQSTLAPSPVRAPKNGLPLASLTAGFGLGVPRALPAGSRGGMGGRAGDGAGREGGGEVEEDVSSA